MRIITDLTIQKKLDEPEKKEAASPARDMLPKEQKPKKWSKKKKIATILIFLSVCIIGGLATFLLWPKNKKIEEVLPLPKKEERVEKSPFDTESPLNGVLTTKNVAMRRPIGIVIENHPDARPQSGLDKAGLVYEAVTEGGITRFLAFFVENDLQEVGPIRSARTYTIKFADEYSAFYAHVGGSGDGLALIKELDNFYDLNEFGLGKFFWRDKKRYAPHNMYSATDSLRKAGESKKWDINAEYDKWLFKDEPKIEERGNAKKISIDFSSSSYKIDYYYDRDNNLYKRNLANKEHTDKNSKEQIKPRTVIVQYVQSWMKAPEYAGGGQSTEIKNDGTGKAIIFMDGKKIAGTWKKNGRKTRTKFFDESGDEIKFSRGSVWIEMATTNVKVTDE